VHGVFEETHTRSSFYFPPEEHYGGRFFQYLENRPDVYDGASPHVIWSSPLGSSCSPIGHRWLHAHHKLADIIDAVEPGGSGDLFVTLNHDERDALAAQYRYGYPRGAESQLWAFSPWTWGFVNTMHSDPTYHEDFWNAPGYLGHDDPERLAHLVINTTATVRKVMSGAEAMTDISMLVATAGVARDHGVGIVLDDTFEDLDALFGASVRFTSGKAKGRTVVISTVIGEMLSTSGEHEPDLFNGVEAGDELTIDNRDFIAWCHMFLHTLSLDLLIKDDESGQRHYPEGFEGLRAYAVDDRPLYPQRDLPIVPQEGGGAGHSGRFTVSRPRESR
jgi:hypothetical protein